MKRILYICINKTKRYEKNNVKFNPNYRIN